MRRLKLLMTLGAFLCAFSAVAADLGALVPSLKQGGYVIVVRHASMDESQKDVFPFVFDDMKSQRQLSEQGRQVARDMDAAMRALRIPIGIVYTSQLNRAVETGTLMSDQPVVPRKELTDASAGSASAMANPSGANSAIGNVIRKLVNTAPESGANNVLVTHKTNIADAFGKVFSDVKEGEALVYKPNVSGEPALVVRVQAVNRRWIGTPYRHAETHSVFGIVVGGVASEDNTLLCDDLGDEWADFIGLNSRGDIPILSFYHAKHGPLSLGASPFHVAVSQAIKNLGRLALPAEVMDRKIASWVATYSNDGVQTRIPRVLRGGDAAELSRSFREARLAPGLVKRVCIVTSSLSRQ